MTHMLIRVFVDGPTGSGALPRLREMLFRLTMRCGVSCSVSCASLSLSLLISFPPSLSHSRLSMLIPSPNTCNVCEPVSTPWNVIGRAQAVNQRPKLCRLQFDTLCRLFPQGVINGLSDAVHAWIVVHVGLVLTAHKVQGQVERFFVGRQVLGIT